MSVATVGFLGPPVELFMNFIVPMNNVGAFLFLCANDLHTACRYCFVKGFMLVLVTFIVVKYIDDTTACSNSWSANYSSLFFFKFLLF